MFKHLNFGKTGFKTSVFEKHFISYSCILFIKFNALMIFCNILLWFSKNCFFQNFDQSKVFFDQSKLPLKFWFGSVCFDQCSIGSRSIKAFSTDWIYFSIDWKSYRESFKKLSFSRVLHYSNFFQNSFSLYSIGPRVKARFLSFSTKFLQGFLSSKAGKTFIPLIFLLFSVFMHFGRAFGLIFKP